MLSHELIYQYVLKDKQAGGLLFKHLRTGQKVYKKHYGSKDRLDIVQNKERVGDLKST